MTNNILEQYPVTKELSMRQNVAYIGGVSIPIDGYGFWEDAKVHALLEAFAVAVEALESIPEPDFITNSDPNNPYYVCESCEVTTPQESISGHFDHCRYYKVEKALAQIEALLGDGGKGE